jgi:hypothetical protein
MKLPVKDRTTIPWMTPREIPAIKAVLSAWRKLRRDEKDECDRIRSGVAELALPLYAINLNIAEAAHSLEIIAALDERLRKEFGPWKEARDGQA